jgi:hypothetical protein
MGEIVPIPRFGMHGTALVAIEDEHVTLSTVLVLQEMGLAVDIVVDRERSVAWAARAGYTYVVCGGEDDAAVTDYAIRMRHAVPETRVIMIAGPGFEQTNLESIGVEVLTSPVDVNLLVERLWPAQAA